MMTNHNGSARRSPIGTVPLMILAYVGFAKNIHFFLVSPGKQNRREGKSMWMTGGRWLFDREWVVSLQAVVRHNQLAIASLLALKLISCCLYSSNLADTPISMLGSVGTYSICAETVVVFSVWMNWPVCPKISSLTHWSWEVTPGH